MKRPVKRHEVAQPLDQSYRLIPLTQGQNAIIDAADFEWLNQWNWCAYWNNYTKSFYAGRSARPRQMHRFILGCEPEERCDHKNHDTLDNRRKNLRKCSVLQNNRNRLPYSASGFKGVYRYQRRKGGPLRWVALIYGASGKNIYVGNYTTPEAAAHAYDEVAKVIHGEFAYLNFPNSV